MITYNMFSWRNRKTVIICWKLLIGVGGGGGGWKGVGAWRRGKTYLEP